MKKETSEFGKGFIYNLVLFAKHWWKHFSSLEQNYELAAYNPELWHKGEYDMWFNGAGDHFYEFEIPKQFENTEIGKLAKELQDEALERRLGTTTKEEFDNFFVKLENLCILIDKYLGINDIPADFE